MVERSSPGDFWSRRRAGVAAEAAAEDAAFRAAEATASRAALEREQAEKTDDELLAELALPDPDTMGQGDDFAAFMRSAVPDHLRRRALRQLWRSNPVLANLDGLVDHGEDFSDAATVLPDMKTAYQVGRGMMRHVMALAETADASSETERAEVADAEPEAIDPDRQDEPADAVSAQNGTGTDQAPTSARRRHMRFVFETTTEGAPA